MLSGLDGSPNSCVVQRCRHADLQICRNQDEGFGQMGYIYIPSHSLTIRRKQTHLLILYNKFQHQPQETSTATKSKLNRKNVTTNNPYGSLELPSGMVPGKRHHLQTHTRIPPNKRQPEFAHPYEVLSPHADLVIASPNGGATVLDPVSVQLFKDDAYCQEFARTQEKLWTETKKLSDFTGKAKEFTAIFYVGGFGRKISSLAETWRRKN